MMNLKRLFYRNDGSPRWWIPLVGLFTVIIAAYIIWELINAKYIIWQSVFFIVVVPPLYISLMPLMYSILFRKGIIISIFIFIALATLWKYEFNGLSDKGAPSEPCFSVKEAKNAGVFVCKFAVQPNPITNNNTSVLMGDAWIERVSKPTTMFIWFPYRKIQSGYEIMIKREKIKTNPNNPQNWDAESMHPVGVIGGSHAQWYQIRIEEFAPNASSVYQFNILKNAPPVVLKPIFEETSK